MRTNGGTPLVSYGVPEPPTCGSSIPRPRTECGRRRSVRSGCTATTSPRLLGETRADRADLQRQVVDPSSDAGRSVAADRRPRLHLRGRALHRRPHQGSPDRRGRNHYPDDIEATIRNDRRPRRGDLGAGRTTEQLVAIIEVKKRGDTETRYLRDRLPESNAMSLGDFDSTRHRAADLVLVPRGSIPITTSGKIRRSSCADYYRKDQFARLDEGLERSEPSSRRRRPCREIRWNPT